MPLASHPVESLYSGSTG